MRIVIDLEAAQSPMSRNRGIGRYSTSLARGMLRQRGNHEILVALNGMYADSVVPVREALEGLVRPSDIRIWQATQPPRAAHSPAGRHAGERVRHSFFESLRADCVHVASLFEHDALSFTTIGAFPTRHRTAVTLYDLIPHLNREVYFPGAGMSQLYDAKLEHLRRADTWLAISASSRQEGVDHLGLPPDRVTNISSAADEHFVPGPVAPETEVALRVGYGLWKPFVMYTGGIDPRKNVEGLLRAWAALPMEMRCAHQLAIVCSVHAADRERLQGLAIGLGLGVNDVVFTGFVQEDHLVLLYRLCKLFVFPSLHEGFGLPALEAMSCGAAAIGANNSSIPEVIGRDDALFDARSTAAITASIQRCLADDLFREELARRGPQQARNFSWDRSARAALDAIEAAHQPKPPLPAPGGRRTLAYVSPLPPERSGIADYSAELLPALAQHYDIDVIVEQAQLAPEVAQGVRAVHDAQWFAAHGQQYDRILYHFGNSQFHEHMLPLLRLHPGTVVLHDFYLSGMQAHRELVLHRGPVWTQALYDSHGWRALVRRAKSADLVEIIHEFPANFDVLRDAHGIIVHSPYSARLAREWYGPGAGDGWAQIPHLRVALPRHREEARDQLGLKPHDVLVCSFGIVAPTKMNERLLRAWKLSSLSTDAHCHLVFVGENDAGEYGRQLLLDMQTAGGRARVTGWADPETFRLYLNAADFAVQLRTLSKGETSGTVLDAMCHGLPVIANANGSMAYLPREAVILLDEEFDDAQLVAALESLRNDAALRRNMGDAARHIIETRHSPSDCARAFNEAIEAFAARESDGPNAVARAVVPELRGVMDASLLPDIARAVAGNQPDPAPARQLLVDVGAYLWDAALLPALVPELVYTPRAGWRLEPVYRAPDGHWRYAHNFMLRYYDCPAELLPDSPLEMRRDDVWCSVGNAPTELPQEVRAAGLEVISLPEGGDADLLWAYVGANTHAPRGARWFIDVSELSRREWKAGIQRVVTNYLLQLLHSPPAGVTVVPVDARDNEAGYRLALPLLERVCGIPASERAKDRVIEMGAGDTFFALDLQPSFIRANRAALRDLRGRGVRIAYMVYDLLPIVLPDCFFADAASQHEEWLAAVAESDLAVCISASVAAQLADWFKQRGIEQPPQIAHVHLGGDMAAHKTTGRPLDAAEILDAAEQHSSFLMVGTVEPRKAHAQVLDAFERLWQGGSDAVLVITGRAGWMTEALADRLRSHAELGRRLFWLEGASDEFVDVLYESCSALILASRGEGFGLPLVEAAQHGLPIIARDLPVFREVAGEHAFYFTGDSAQALAGAIEEWLRQHGQGTHPQSQGMPWLTWQQSAAQLRGVLQADQPSV